jgi:hypothetical protein
MGTKVSKNLEIGGGEIDGGLNLSKNNNETMGININIDGGNKGIDIDTNFNELKISSQEDKNKEQMYAAQLLQLNSRLHCIRLSLCFCSIRYLYCHNMLQTRR